MTAISSSNYDKAECSSNVIYSSQHLIDVFCLNRPPIQKSVSLAITSLSNAIKIKIRDTSEYGFNYTAIIDWSKFEYIRTEQSLDITFDEFQPQIIDLLNQTNTKQMQMRLDITDTKCKLIFYEKSRLKSLIFLTIDLELTNQKEIIEELSENISNLQNYNKSLATQLAATKNQLLETELMLKSAVSKNSVIEKQFYKDLELILQTFLSRIKSTEANISSELTKLTARHQKLVGNLDIVKKESCIKNESNTRLLQTMQNLRIDNERQQRVINELKTEVEVLKIERDKIDDCYKELKTNLTSKETILVSLQSQMNELRRDMQDATLIIAQKTKTNDEIGKDLIEANRLLVNFNAQYDLLSNEVEELKEKIACKDEVIRGQATELEKLNRGPNSLEEINNLHLQLGNSKQRLEELEKQYKDAIKLNGLLAKKLSNTELYDVRNVNVPLPNKS